MTIGQKKIDIPYLAETMANLMGIPVRIYRNGIRAVTFSLARLPKDPVDLIEEELLSLEGNIRTYYTDDFHYYVILRHEETRIVFGPSRICPLGDQELKEMAFRLGVLKDEVGEFMEAMKSMVTMPLQSIVQSVLMLNYVLNDEKLALADIIGADEGFQPPRAEPETPSLESFNNSMATEEKVMTIIRRGDVDALEGFVQHAPAVNSGILAREHVRQLRNTFIVTTTLACRAAIQGGMDGREAFALSDAYIQRCETTSDVGSLANLSITMIRDYTDRVHRLRQDGVDGTLALQVRSYVLSHLSEPIRTEDVAKSLFLSRSHLSTKFREETGTSLHCFIQREKMREAEHLLKKTDSPIASIALYLGFSSQSHFTRVFQSFEGISPSAYRAKRT